MLTLITINIVLFIKTAMRIIVQNSDNRRQLKQFECQRQFKKLDKYEQVGHLYIKIYICIFYFSFLMLFRLFVIVGVVWILEIITYICSVCKIYNNWTKAADCVTSAHGIILFAVTILKKDVLKGLANR